MYVDNKTKLFIEKHSHNDTKTNLLPKSIYISFDARNRNIEKIKMKSFFPMPALVS